MLFYAGIQKQGYEQDHWFMVVSLEMAEKMGERAICMDKA